MAAARIASVAGVVAALGAFAVFAAEAGPGVAEAVMQQDSTALRTLLREKADVNAPLADGSTALHWAVENDDPDTVELLLQAGAKADAADRYGLTPLYYAASNGDAAVLQKLLKAGANPNAANKEGDSALMAAARAGKVEAVTALLGRDAAANAKDGLTGETALMWAARMNRTEAAQALLDHGADVNARTRTGKTPERRLPGLGGGPGNGSHGVGIVRGGWPERGVRDAIPGGMSPLLYAARDGALDAVRVFVNAKADVNQTEANGITPLLMAITNDHLNIARFLLEHGAPVNTADWWGRTPLWAAVEIRNRDLGRGGDHDIDRGDALDLIKTLMAGGANVNARTKEYSPIRRWVAPLNDISWVDFTGQTPFLRAALSGDITVMRLLLDHGADPNIATFAGTTALMASAGVNWAENQTYTESKESLMAALQLCLEKGAEVNAANSMGITAVIGAANRGSDDLLEVLVARGARLDVKDKEGRTPLVWAGGVFLATNPPEEKPSTMALIRKLMGTASSGTAAETQTRTTNE
jgi:ankyrin repeat protein